MKTMRIEADGGQRPCNPEAGNHPVADGGLSTKERTCAI
jgi:hypothetical protein